MISFTVYGEPKALKRHRTVRCGQFNREYDPSAPDKSDFLAKCQAHRPALPLTGPLKLEIIATFGRPKNHYRSGKNAGRLKEHAPNWHTSRPDQSNIEKFVEDALNGIFFKDDSQIAHAEVLKLYGNTPCVGITIKELELPLCTLDTN